MKKFLSCFACIAMILVAGVTLAACGGAQTNDYITPSTGASFSESSVKFSNANDFTLEYKGKNHYVAKGSASTMTQEQATAWGTEAGSKFVVVNVKMGKNSTAVVGWRNDETKGTAFEAAEIDGTLIKNVTAANDTKNFILALTDGETLRHADKTIWRIEVKAAESEDVGVYTIDFSAFYETEEQA